MFPNWVVVVSMLALYYDNASLIPTDFWKIVVEKHKNQQKEAVVGPFFKKFSTSFWINWVNLDVDTAGKYSMEARIWSLQFEPQFGPQFQKGRTRFEVKVLEA